jgi:hypothetical protein
MRSKVTFMSREAAAAIFFPKQEFDLRMKPAVAASRLSFSGASLLRAYARSYVLPPLRG